MRRIRVQDESQDARRAPRVIFNPLRAGDVDSIRSCFVGGMLRCRLACRDLRTCKTSVWSWHGLFRNSNCRLPCMHKGSSLGQYPRAVVKKGRIMACLRRALAESGWRRFSYFLAAIFVTNLLTSVVMYNRYSSTSHCK